MTLAVQTLVSNSSFLTARFLTSPNRQRTGVLYSLLPSRRPDFYALRFAPRAALSVRARRELEQFGQPLSRGQQCGGVFRYARSEAYAEKGGKKMRGTRRCPHDCMHTRGLLDTLHGPIVERVLAPLISPAR